LFFIGTAAYLLMKMFMGRDNKIGKYVMATLGLLSLVLMGLGLIGFTTKVDATGEAKAQGAMGTAYAMYKDAYEGGSTRIEATRTQLANLSAATVPGTETLLPDTTPLSAMGATGTALATAFDVETLGEAKAALAHAISEGEKTLKDGKAAYTAILLTYISMMLVFGLIPLIRGTKKIIGCCMKESDETQSK